MRFPVRPGHAPVAAVELTEVVAPRTNTAAITAAENLLAGASLPEPFSLEVAATCETRWFLIRTGSPTLRLHLERRLGAAYPQAEIRALDVARHPSLDPAGLAPDEQVAAATLVLRASPCLPLRTFGDKEVAGEESAQADPLLGILAALGDLPAGWRSLSQLVLRPAPQDWCRGYLELAVERPLAPRPGGHAESSPMDVVLLAALFAVAALGLQVYRWYLAAQWLNLGLLLGGLGVGLPAFFWLAGRLSRRQVYDPQLVREKVSRPAYQAEVRLAVFAPAAAPAAAVRERLARLAAAHRQFDLPSGNGLVPRALSGGGLDLRRLDFLSSSRQVALLNVRELAGLWHLPLGLADVPLIERTGPRLRLPLPYTVARGCRLGVAAQQGRAVPVCLSDELLRRHLLLVAKTRRGKSSLLLHLARYLMAEGGPQAQPPAVVLVDPHRDLARAALGLVPEGRREQVVYLDVAERDRPFGLNLLDTALGWDRDKAVANILMIFRREFDRFWGPRMEDAFRFALLTLYEANEAICAADPDGRSRQHTILDVPALFVEQAFRAGVVGLVRDPVVKAWWSGYFDPLDRRLQLEIVNPVQTKVQRFAGSRAARAIVGQPRSTLAPGEWLGSGAVVVVSTAKGEVGEDTAALVGGTLINLVGLLLGEQAALPEDRRRRATLIVDEFHSMPGADYEAILSELAKYGANLVLATQSLARLDALDREGRRALRATVFANVDGLFAFHTSAEDARYLAPELGEHRCYARISAGGERLPAFSIHLDPPPPADQVLAQRLAAASAARYGRERAAVEADLTSALARVEACRRVPTATPRTDVVGFTREVAPVAQGQSGRDEERGKARNDNRQAKPRPPAAQQIAFLDQAAFPTEVEGTPDLAAGAVAARPGEGTTP